MNVGAAGFQALSFLRIRPLPDRLSSVLTRVHALSHRRGESCYFEPLAREGSHWQCAERCAAMGASLPCIDSADKDEFVARQMFSRGGLYLWLGLYNVSARADAPSPYPWTSGCNTDFTNWDAAVDAPLAETSTQYGVRCAVMGTVFRTSVSFHKWRDVPCDEIFAAVDVGSEVKCFCEGPASTSAAYAAWNHTAATLAINAEYASGAAGRVTTPLLLSLLVVGVLPLMLCLGQRAYLKLRAVPDDAGADNQIMRSTSRRLQAHKRAGSRVRTRISGLFAVLGWTLLIPGLAPFFAIMLEPAAVARPPLDLASAAFGLGSLVPVGISMLLFALLPTDKVAIGFVARLMLCIYSMYAVVAISFLAAGIASLYASFVIFLGVTAALALACGGLMVPTQLCGSRTMTPRQALRQTWLVWRLFQTGFALTLGPTAFMYQDCIRRRLAGDVTQDKCRNMDPNDGMFMSCYILCSSMVVCAVVFENAPVRSWLQSALRSILGARLGSLSPQDPTSGHDLKTPSSPFHRPPLRLPHDARDVPALSASCGRGEASRRCGHDGGRQVRRRDP